MPRSVFAGTVLLALAFMATRAPASGEELLSNSGFESGIDPWSATHGQLDAVSSPVHGGARAARLSSSALQAHEVYRTVFVAPGEAYQFSGYLLLNDPSVERAFLRVSWFDAGGGLVSQADSAWLTLPAPDYQFVTTGTMKSPLTSTSARVGVRVQASSPFDLYFDDFSFNGAVPPPTSPPTPGPTTAAPTATPAPATHTPAPATPTKAPAGTPDQDEEPIVFDSLTNGGFEVTRADGSPYAWKDVGADLEVTGLAAAEGARSLSLVSRSSSTKWAYQTVRVQPGAFYEAAAHTWNAGGEETFLRVSWYASEDGSGTAIDSSDSTAVAARGNAFQFLTSGPVQAPAEARTAKVRLMLRPGSASAVTVYFDAVSFAVTGARPGAETSEPVGRPRSGGGPAVSGRAGPDAGTAPESLVERRPLGFANVAPAATAPPGAVAGSSHSYDWLAVIGIAVGGAAIAYAAATELSRRRKSRDTER